MSSFGRILRQHRQSQAMSLRTLGAEAQFGFTFLSQVERGERRATEDLAKRCDKALNANGAIIDAYLQQHTGDGDMQRRVLMQALGVLAASPLALVQWEAIRNGVTAAVEDGLDYQQWDEIVEDYGNVYYRMSADQVTDSLRADITVL